METDGRRGLSGAPPALAWNAGAAFGSVRRAGAFEVEDGGNMNESSGERGSTGYSSLTRRERLERIATAERDRRAGRIELALATIGEPVEWPARAVVAICRLPADEADARRVLEEGLDLWAREAGLGDLDADRAASAHPSRSVGADVSEAVYLRAATGRPEDQMDPIGLLAHLEQADRDAEASLDAPLDPTELERAFEQAEADVEAMHDVNDVAEQVLMNEAVADDDLAQLAGDELIPVDPEDQAPDTLGMDAAYVAASDPDVAPADEGDADETQAILATLESWLINLERRKAGRPS